MEIAEKRNITVSTICFEPKGLNGLWLYFDDSEHIFLDTRQVKDEKLSFVLTHELGHSALHKNRINGAAYFSDKRYRTKVEAVANGYAEGLLQGICEGGVSHA